MNPRHASSITAVLPVLCLLHGCGSPASKHVGPPATPAEQACNELDEQIGSLARDISRTAASLGSVDRLDVPGWLVGGDKVVSLRREQLNARLQEQQAEQDNLRRAREQSCS